MLDVESSTFYRSKADLVGLIVETVDQFIMNSMESETFNTKMINSSAK